MHIHRAEDRADYNEFNHAAIPLRSAPGTVAHGQQILSHGQSAHDSLAIL
jgi:hypothetical protein